MSGNRLPRHGIQMYMLSGEDTMIFMGTGIVGDRYLRDKIVSPLINLLKMSFIKCLILPVFNIFLNSRHLQNTRPTWGADPLMSHPYPNPNRQRRQEQQ